MSVVDMALYPLIADRPKTSNEDSTALLGYF